MSAEYFRGYRDAVRDVLAQQRSRGAYYDGRAYDSRYDNRGERDRRSGQRRPDGERGAAGPTAPGVAPAQPFAPPTSAGEPPADPGRRAASGGTRSYVFGYGPDDQPR